MQDQWTTLTELRNVCTYSDCLYYTFFFRTFHILITNQNLYQCLLTKCNTRMIWKIKSKTILRYYRIIIIIIFIDFKQSNILWHASFISVLCTGCILMSIKYCTHKTVTSLLELNISIGKLWIQNEIENSVILCNVTRATDLQVLYFLNLWVEFWYNLKIHDLR
jgi:hypothetical protein